MQVCLSISEIFRELNTYLKCEKKEEGPERGDLCRPTRREFRCLLCLGIWHRLLLGKAVANLGGDHICYSEIYDSLRLYTRENVI